MAVLRAQSRLAITEKKQISIDLQLDSALKLQIPQKNAHSALLVCDEKIFPIIRKLLFILVTRIVTTATPAKGLFRLFVVSKPIYEIQPGNLA